MQLLNELSYLIIVAMAGLRSTVHRHLVQELEVLDLIPSRASNMYFRLFLLMQEEQLSVTGESMCT